MKIVVDDKIPYIQEKIALLADEVVFLPGAGIEADDVKDADAPATLLELAIKTVADAQKLQSLSENVLKLALPDSADIIAKEVIKLAGK